MSNSKEGSTDSLINIAYSVKIPDEHTLDEGSNTEGVKGLAGTFSPSPFTRFTKNILPQQRPHCNNVDTSSVRVSDFPQLQR